MADEIFPDREAAEAATKENSKAIDALQDALWAERDRALLVILQGIDTDVYGYQLATGPYIVFMVVGALLSVRFAQTYGSRHTYLVGALIRRRKAPWADLECGGV